MTGARPGLLLLLALVLGAGGARAQQDPAEGPVVVDRVVAVVGNHAILESQVQEQLYARQSAGLLATDARAQDAARAFVIDSLINARLMLRAAQQDTTITVADGDVADAVQKRVTEVRSTPGGRLTAACRKPARARSPSLRRWRRTPRKRRHW